MINKIFGFIIAISLFIAPGIVSAQMNYVHDNANVLSPAMREKLEKLLTELDEKKNLRIEEVILASFDNRDPATVVNELAQSLDSHGSKAEYRALVLFVLDNKLIEIFPNEKLATILNEKNKANIIRNAQLKLNEKNYDEMARIGVAGIFHYFQNDAAAQGSEKAPGGSTKKIVNLLMIVIGLVAVVGLIMLNRKKS